MTCSAHPNAKMDAELGCLGCWFRSPAAMAGKEPIPDRACLVCSHEFTPSYPNEKMCSPKCKRTRALALGRYESQERRTCKLRDCRNKFRPTCKTQKFCTDACRREWYRTNNYKTEWMRDHRRQLREAQRNMSVVATVTSAKADRGNDLSMQAQGVQAMRGNKEVGSRPKTSMPMSLSSSSTSVTTRL